MSGDALQPEVEMFISLVMGEWSVDLMETANDLAETLISMRREFWKAYRQRPGAECE